MPTHVDNIRRCIAGLAAIAGCVGCAAPGTNHAAALVLDGEQRFIADDRPVFAEVDYDDGEWPMVRVPSSWTESGHSPDANVAWYRFRFRVPAELRGADLGLYLGVMTGADAAYLNGVLIGSSGTIDRNHPVEALYIPRLYPLPSQALRETDENVMAVRVWAEYAGRGLSETAPAVDRYAVVDAMRDRDAASQKMRAELTVVAVALIYLACFAVSFGRGPLDRRALLLLFAAVAGLSVTVIDLPQFYESGLKTPVIQHLHHFAFAAAICLILAWVGAHQSRPPRALVPLIALGLILAVVIGFIREPTILVANVFAQMIYTAVLTVYVLRQTLLSVRDRLAHAWVWTLVTLFFPAIYISDLSAYLSDIEPAGVITTALIVVSSLAGIGLLVRQILENRARLAKAVAKAESARRDERQRVARELHDGVSQDLMAVHLTLSALATEPGGAKLSPVQLQVQQALGSVRRAAHELHEPEPNLIGRLHVLIKDMRRAGLEASLVFAEAAYWEALKPATQRELIRIAQEAFANIIRHADATRVEVKLAGESHMLSLSISDDGKGFDVASVSSDGIGLPSMRARAAELNGTAKIESSEAGTTVRVIVPRDGAQ